MSGNSQLFYHSESPGEKSLCMVDFWKLSLETNRYWTEKMTASGHRCGAVAQKGRTCMWKSESLKERAHSLCLLTLSERSYTSKSRIDEASLNDKLKSLNKGSTDKSRISLIHAHRTQRSCTQHKLESESVRFCCWKSALNDGFPSFLCRKQRRHMRVRQVGDYIENGSGLILSKHTNGIFPKGKEPPEVARCHAAKGKYEVTTSHLVAAKTKQTLHGLSLCYPNKSRVCLRTYLWLTKPWHPPLSCNPPTISFAIT